jgi:hypothetical protein
VAIVFMSKVRMISKDRSQILIVPSRDPVTIFSSPTTCMVDTIPRWAGTTRRTLVPLHTYNCPLAQPVIKASPNVPANIDTW